jgi:glycosyltransferase involved in cell wall biosynthesis
VGFVLEQTLGHVTFGDNLRKLLPREPAIDAELFDVEWPVHGVAARTPVYNSNWTVRAGIRASRGIRRMHRSRRLDALFVHTQVPAVLAAWWMHRLPTVVSLDATPLQYDALGLHYEHATGRPSVERLKWRANRACFRRAARIVTFSDWARLGVVDGYGIDPEKITVIPPGVDPSQWTAPRRDDRAEEPVRILFVGGDLPRKGGDVLLEAFGRLRARHSGTRARDVELHLVTGADVPPTPGVTVHRGLKPNSDPLVDLYRRSDVFCLPTLADCLPNVLSEAAAASLPLVSTPVAAIPEIVRDGDTGLLVAPGDAGALENALQTLVGDAALRTRLGTNARHLAERQLDATRNVHRLVELLLVAAGREPVDERGGSARG